MNDIIKRMVHDGLLRDNHGTLSLPKT